MVLRALFTLWFSLTSVLAPALCCCTPFGAPAAHADSVTSPKAPSESGCPHCKESQSSTSPVNERAPAEPTKQCPGQCPCKNHSLASALPDTEGQDLRAVVHFTWLPDLSAFTLVSLPYVPAANISAASTNHTGPPPLSGVELLHRIQVLLC